MTPYTLGRAGGHAGEKINVGTTRSGTDLWILDESQLNVKNLQIEQRGIFHYEKRNTPPRKHKMQVYLSSSLYIFREYNANGKNGRTNNYLRNQQIKQVEDKDFS